MTEHSTEIKEIYYIRKIRPAFLQLNLFVFFFMLWDLNQELCAQKVRFSFVQRHSIYAELTVRRQAQAHPLFSD